MNKKSLKLYARAKKVIPGGVNSPVRAFLSVNQKPFFVKKAHGQYLVDEDNNKIIDYIGSWGAQILGHGHSKIKNTLTASLRKGITYGAPCSREVELAERITKIYPSINKVRMVSSGTEATMSAIRLARGYTGRNKILKFNEKKDEQIETKIFDIEDKDEPLVLTNEIKNGKSEILNNNLSPAVRKIVTEKNLKPEGIRGSGKRGAILKGDLLNLMNKTPEPNQRKIKYGPEERIQMSRLRQTIAKRLKQAQENAALLTTFNEVDMTSIIEMRKENQEDFQNRYGIKLGFMSFFVRASTEALKRFPAVNASIDRNDIVYHGYQDIGVAVSSDRGLVVPVIRDADSLSLAEIEDQIRIYGERARDGKLGIDEMTGGTFTISNGGVFGSLLSTPILNPPQTAVLGMHNIIERAIVIDGEIKIRPIMYLALSYDHRIIDGKESVSFLKMIKENLEEPRRLFLDI